MAAATGADVGAVAVVAEAATSHISRSAGFPVSQFSSRPAIATRCPELTLQNCPALPEDEGPIDGPSRGM